MLSRILIIAASLTLFGTAAAAETSQNEKPEVSAEEQAKAVEYFGMGRRMDLARMKERHPDGVKGVSFQYDHEMPFFTGVIKDFRLDALRRWACKAEVFGEYELVGQKGFVGKDGRGVFTKLRFKLIDDWRVDRRASPVVQLVVLGGEANWEGEPVRFENKSTQFRLNTHYVLVEGTSVTKRNATIYSSPYFMEVDNGAIYSAPGWTPFASGTSLSQAKKDVAKALSIKGCI